MAFNVQCADSDDRGEVGPQLERAEEQALNNTSKTSEAPQTGKNLSMDPIEQGLTTVTEADVSNDGRRRSSRLRGKVAPKSTGLVGAGIPPVVKAVQGTGRRGRRKKGAVVESGRSNGGELVVVEPMNIIEANVVRECELEATRQVDNHDGGARPADDDVGAAPVGCVSVGNIAQKGEVSEEKAVKVKRLEDLGVLDDGNLCEDDRDDDTGIAAFFLDNNDNCDSNIYENLPSIVNLNLKEDVSQTEVLAASGAGRQVTLTPRVEDVPADVDVEIVLRKKKTEKVASVAVVGGLDESAELKNTTPSNAEPNCETTLHTAVDVERNEKEAVDVKVTDEAGFGESNDNVMTAKECNEDGVKSNADPGEDSSSVTSQDNVAHRASGSKDRSSIGISSDEATGFSGAVHKDSVIDEKPAASLSSEPPRDGASQVRSRVGMSKQGDRHGEVGQVVSENMVEGRSLEISVDNLKLSALGNQGVGGRDAGEQKESSITSEGGLRQATLENSGSERTGKGKRDELSAGEGLEENESDGSGKDRVQSLNAIVNTSQPEKISNAGHGMAAASVNTSKRRTGITRKFSAEAQISEMAENYPVEDSQGIRKRDSQLGEGEDSTQLAEKTDSLKSVNQESGPVGNVARHTQSTAAGEDNSSGVTEGEANTTAEKVDESVGVSAKAGWVKCDDCDKWRSIPVELAEEIEEKNAYWNCKRNPNKEFADCSIPQGKSNEEINLELGISESSLCEEGDDVDATGDSRLMYDGAQEKTDYGTVTENGQSVWTLIRRNIFKHRSQKHQDVDEAMVCQCTIPKDGGAACGEDCLNRMLNVECLAQQCPCGPACTNQQFQKRSYANVELFRCGKKGHGLRAMENIPSGTFIIEYVGEVLDMPSFEVRQKEYAVNLQKHFYFMTLSSNEIIDACSKGNLGRFINHSCEPNCQTEKWMVDGEVCIGLFAIRDLREGEEITFDYNFVRVGGAVAKKCECGAPNCRGFIGVDPDTPHTVVEIESDDGEDPEPVMLQLESDEEFDRVDKSKERLAKKARMAADLNTTEENGWEHGGVKRKFSSAGGVKDMKNPKRVRRVKTTGMSKLNSHEVSRRRGFTGGNRVDGSRLGIRNNHYSEVESKLGELTYTFGGLKNRRDTAKQYLKLLVLTAASGGAVNGAAGCSVRDLSMLLEALLKTDRMGVLKDIMSKNGLQMFHNLLKQFRKVFEKRPMLRKLLKVLDHLASCKVLTVEHIYCPPRSGMECFSDTLFELSRHDDLEVQNMARNFRRLYVPPRPHRTDSSNDSTNHRQSPSLMHLQSHDHPQKNQRDQVQTSPPSGDSHNVQTDKSMVNTAPQQSPPIHTGSTPVLNGAVIKSSSSLITSQLDKSKESSTVLQDGTAEGNLVKPPAPTRRKRPSRWDTPETAATVGVQTAAPIPVPTTSSRNTMAPQTVLATQCSSNEHDLNRDSGVSSESPKPPGVTLHEASRHLQSGLPPEQDKLASAPRGLPSSSSQPCAPVPIPSSSPRPLPQSGGPRWPPPGLGLHGQPLGQPMLVQNGVPQNLVFQGCQRPVGMPGQRPMVQHPAPIHLGTQGVPIGNDMSELGHMPFPGRNTSGPNMYMGGPPPHPWQTGTPLMPEAGVHLSSFGFPPRHPNPPPMHGGVNPVAWSRMHPGGVPMYAGHPPPPRPTPQHSAWAHSGPRLEFQSPVPPMCVEVPETGACPVKPGAPTSQSGSTRVSSNELEESEALCEPPVPGLSPVKPHTIPTSSEKTVQGRASLDCAQGSMGGPHHQTDVARGGGTHVHPTLTKMEPCKSIPPHTDLVSDGSAVPGRGCQFVSSHRDGYENKRHEQNWHASHYAHPPAPEKKGSAHHSHSQSGNSKGINRESDMGQSIQSWDTPECPSFRHQVSIIVRSRVEMKQMIQAKDLKRFCDKLTDVVTGKEIKKYKEYKSQGIVRPILRSKLLEKVDAYVDLQADIYIKTIKTKHGEGQP